MKAERKDATILILDDKPEVSAVLEGTITSWEMKAESITDPKKILNHIDHTFYNIILLNVFMRGESVRDLISQITELSPDTKIILMTESAARDAAIEALSLGAFDVVEKPINFQLLFHSVHRALCVQRNEWQLIKTSEDLERLRDDLMIYKSRLEKRNKQLVETNKALSVLAQNIETTRIETEKEIVLKIRCLIMPTIEKLQQTKNSGSHEAELKMLMRHVEDLTSGLSSDLKIATLLTSSELRIASLVKNGLTTEEIANQLHISSSTVKTHRRNIRKKLGINKKQYSLRNYIDSKANLWNEVHLAH